MFPHSKHPTTSEESLLTQYHYQTESTLPLHSTQENIQEPLTETFLPFLHLLTSFCHQATSQQEEPQAEIPPLVLSSEQLYARSRRVASLLLEVTIHLATHTKKNENERGKKHQSTTHVRTGELRLTIAEHHTVLKPFVTTELDYEIRSSSSRSFGEWR